MLFRSAKPGLKYIRQEWKCNFGSEIKYPKTIPIYFGLNSTATAIDYCDFQTIIKHAETEYPHVDFGKCLKSSLDDAFSFVSNSDDFKSIAYTDLRKLFKKPETDLAMYRSKAEKRANLESLNTDSGSNFRKIIPVYITSIKNYCCLLYTSRCV